MADLVQAVAETLSVQVQAETELALEAQAGIWAAYPWGRVRYGCLVARRDAPADAPLQRLLRFAGGVIQRARREEWDPEAPQPDQQRGGAPPPRQAQAQVQDPGLHAGPAYREWVDERPRPEELRRTIPGETNDELFARLAAKVGVDPVTYRRIEASA